MQFFKSFSMFHKIYFIFFLLVNIVVFLSPVIGGTGHISSLLTIDAIIPLISSVTGIFAAIYTARAQKWAYVWGFFNVAAYIFVSLSKHFYGEVSLYLVYMLPMQIIGYISWSKNSSGAVVKPKTMTLKNWIMFFIFLFVFWGCYMTFIGHLPEIFKSVFNITIPFDHRYRLDSFTATLTVCAVILATNRFVEQWYLWIISDSLGAILFITSIIESGHFTATAISGSLMWIQFTSNAIYGYICWRKIQKSQQVVA